MTTDRGRFDLVGRVAIVTGGSTGVGRATAHLLAAFGADVVVAARRAELIDATAASVREGGRRAIAVVTDVRDEAACVRLIERTVDELGRLDVLVNNAGAARVAGPDGWRLSDWQAALDLNLTSVWVLSRLAARVMAATGGGSIVNLSSRSGLTPMPNVAPYGVAKAGVNYLTTVLASEFAGGGVRVNAVALGMVKSEGFVANMERMGRDPDDQRDRILMGRPGTVEEAAYPILFFASDASSFVTGEVLHAGGGPHSWSREYG